MDRLKELDDEEARLEAEFSDLITQRNEAQRKVDANLNRRQEITQERVEILKEALGK